MTRAYHEQLQQQHQQKQQALGRWLLAGCTVVGEVSCRDIGRGGSADAGPAYCKAGGHEGEGVSCGQATTPAPLTSKSSIWVQAASKGLRSLPLQAGGQQPPALGDTLSPCVLLSPPHTGDPGTPALWLAVIYFALPLPTAPSPTFISPASQPHTRWPWVGRAPGALLLLAAAPRPLVTQAARLASLQPHGWSLQ